MASEYINEHELALMLSIGRNYRGFGEPVRPLLEDARRTFDECYSEYKRYMVETKGDKRHPMVQDNFKKALEASQHVEPTQQEITRVFELLVLLSRRCLRTFGRNSHLGEEELGSLAFERWVRYRENFDPTKKSKVSGVRVNAFAYMTQVIKNIIYEEFNKQKHDNSIEDSPLILNTLESQNDMQELEEVREFLLKTSERCSDFRRLMKVAAEFDIDLDTMIKTIIFFDLKPELEANINKNRWDF